MQLNKRDILAALGLAALLASGTVGATAADLQADDLKAMESLLARLGFRPGTVDGVIDDDAKAAISRYQAFAALPVDGQPSEALLTELRQVVEQLAALTKPQEETPSTPKLQPAEPPVAESEPPEVESEPPVAESRSTESQPLAKVAEPKEQMQQISEKPAEDLAAESAEDLAASTTNVKQPEPPKPENDSKKPQEILTDQKKSDQKKPDQSFALEGMISRLLKENQKNSEAAETRTGETSNGESRGGDSVGRDPASQAAIPQVDGYSELKLGFEAATQGEHNLAISHYTNAIMAGNLAPEDLAIAHYNRANAHYYGANNESAIVDYNEAIQLRPDFADAYYNRGFSYREKGERQKSVRDFLKARALGLHRLGVRAPDAIPPSTNPPT